MAVGSGRSYSSEMRHHRRRTFTLTAVYTAMVLAGVAVVILWRRDLPEGIGVAIALVCAVPMAAVFVGSARFSWRYEGIEQLIYARSTSTAFVVMMLSSALFGMLEAFAQIEPLSAWWIYAVGGTTWIGANLLPVSRMS